MMFLAPLLLGGCQLGYVIKSAYHQTGLLRARVPIDEALKDSQLSEEQKRKLLLSIEAHKFAETELGLHHSDAYSTYVHLDRPYVTYVVSAAEKSELKAYRWWFPVAGSVPYKGFFNLAEAKEEAAELGRQGYDTYVRGVSAYSTLGWFNDPILSSMLNYKDFDLVNTVIHETTHATVYIKNQSDFNERLASFMGNIGAREFYLKKEGPQGKTLEAMENDLADEKLFASFITQELKSLEEWYTQRKSSPINETDRQNRLKEIQTRFAFEVRPRLRSADSYKNFETVELNNARLLTYRLYMEKLDDFESVFNHLGRDFRKMLEFCKSLEGSDDPKAQLARAAGRSAQN
jgi:predicted aminopeptidase